MYMDPAEQSQVFAILYTLRPKTVLEWGSGGSTRALLGACDFIERYISVEHVPAWHERVKQAVVDPRLTLQLVPPNKPLVSKKSTPSYKERVAFAAGAEADPAVMADYIAFPRTTGLTFDFVLVDGRARTHCLAEGFDLLRPGGVLVLHDAQREEYHPAIRALGEVHFFEPFKRGQVAMVRKD